VEPKSGLLRVGSASPHAFIGVTGLVKARLSRLASFFAGRCTDESLAASSEQLADVGPHARTFHTRHTIRAAHGRQRVEACLA
jgi:hypothetical protein